MSPRTKEQFETIRTERKKQIMDVALQVFSNYGYHQSSISQIAKQAKISKGLMYNYFHNKEELLRSVMEDGLQYLLRGFDRIEGQDAKEQLKNLIRKAFDFMDDDQVYWRLYFSVILQADVQELLMSKLMEEAMPVFNNMAAVFEKLGFKEPFLEAQLFGAMLDGMGMNYLLNPMQFPKEYCINRVCEMYQVK